MIEGLDEVLDDSQPGVPELRRLIEQILDRPGAQARLIEHQTLQPRAWRLFRLRFAVNGGNRSMIVKRLKPEIGRRTELVEQRWLPAVGLGKGGPAFVGGVADPGGSCVWHVYNDLGEYDLVTPPIDRARVSAAVELIASLHTRFAGHPLLGEVRLHGGDHGIHCYESNVRDAGYALAACHAEAEHEPLRDRLLRRLERLIEELPHRARQLRDWGGPETLLHGDLWAINIFVTPDIDRWHARLIDWDHVAVGPATYDLSTLLLRLPSEHRTWILQEYRDVTARAGWSLPGDRELNVLFETAEYARFANRIIWPAIAIAQDHARWGWGVLSEVETWFEAFRPVLAVRDEASTAGMGPL